MTTVTREHRQVPARPVQRHVGVSQPGDPYERQAEQVADAVMSGRAPWSGGLGGPVAAPTGTALRCGDVPGSACPCHDTPDLAPVLESAGRPLDDGTQRTMQRTLGHDFSRVRVHADGTASRSARSLNALAYTVGQHVVFDSGRFAPGTDQGRRLLAHELTHVVQQQAAPQAPRVMRQMTHDPSGGADAAAEREYGDDPAPNAVKCAPPSWCPAGFCDPYRSQTLAEYYRGKNSVWLLAGISAAVDSRVVPLWREYLAGGAAPKNLTSTFGADFTKSPTTAKTTGYLMGELRSRLTSSPPVVAPSTSRTLNIATLIAPAIASIGRRTSVHQMNFSVPRDVPGNLAGGIGDDQTACKAGAKPSPFNDSRTATGTVTLTRGAGPSVTATPAISYQVKDTIDLCPGDCGTRLEQIATVPLSQFEATGISGDVPFTVDFPAPAQPSFTVPTASGPPSPVPSPAPKPPGP